MTAYNFVALVPDNQQLPRWESNNAWPSFVEFQFTNTGSAIASGDTITTPIRSLPTTGIRISEVEVIFPPQDTNATPTGTFSVGDAGLASRFQLNSSFAAGPGGQADRQINQAQALTNGVVTTGSNYLYGATDATYGVGTNGPVLILTSTASSATGATTGTIRLKVWYWCTGED